MEKKFSHIDDEGKAKMVDVGNKADQHRLARASGFIVLQKETIRMIQENQLKEGDVMTVAEIAGIQAAKKTAELIPLCHPLLLNKVRLKTSIEAAGVEVESEVRCSGKTGVEMEALQAVSTALLTIYDMCKAVDKKMVIKNIVLLEKTKTSV